MGMGSVMAQLSAPEGGLSAIEDYFEGMVRRMTTKPYRSCLLVNSATNSAMGLGPMSKARVPYKDLKLVSEQILKNIRT